MSQALTEAIRGKSEATRLSGSSPAPISMPSPTNHRVAKRPSKLRRMTDLLTSCTISTQRPSCLFDESKAPLGASYIYTGSRNFYHWRREAIKRINAEKEMLGEISTFEVVRNSRFFANRKKVLHRKRFTIRLRHRMDRIKCNCSVLTPRPGAGPVEIWQESVSLLSATFEETDAAQKDCGVFSRDAPLPSRWLERSRSQCGGTGNGRRRCLVTLKRFRK